MTVAEDAIGLTIIIAQYLTCSVFLLFLIHKLLMLTYYPFVTRRDPVAGKLPDDRPFVTVQLPCFNEAAVIRRVIDASCSMKWPRDRFEVHILDDSNDVTVRAAGAGSADGRPTVWPVRAETLVATVAGGAKHREGLWGPWGHDLWNHDWGGGERVPHGPPCPARGPDSPIDDSN